MRTRRRIGEDQRNILCPHIATVGAIGRSSPSLDTPGYFNFMVVVIGDWSDHDVTTIALGRDRDFGKIACRARCCASEDYVFHASTAHRLGAALAHYPADRLQQVGFAAAIRADDTSQPGLDSQFGGLYKAFKTSKLQLLYSHRRRPHG